MFSEQERRATFFRSVRQYCLVASIISNIRSRCAATHRHDLQSPSRFVEEDVLLKLKTYNYDVIVVYENFKGATLQTNQFWRN